MIFFQVIEFPVLYRRRIPPEVEPQTVIIRKTQIVQPMETEIEYKTVIEVGDRTARIMTLLNHSRNILNHRL